jgi:hypothetical protein
MSYKGFLVGLAIFFLNLFDGLVTTGLIASGQLVELNPLMSFLIYNTGYWFLLPKILMGGIVFVLLSKYWDEFEIGRIGGVAVLIYYFMVAIYHIINVVMAYSH